MCCPSRRICARSCEHPSGGERSKLPAAIRSDRSRPKSGVCSPCVCNARGRRQNNLWIDDSVVVELDREGRREELARRATALAREALPGVDIEIVWDGMWTRRLGADYFPDPDMFRIPQPRWDRWGAQAAKHLSDADDYWFHVYKPHAGDTIVDIGAGRGEDVFAFSRAVGPEGRVFAIEPHPVSF